MCMQRNVAGAGKESIVRGSGNRAVGGDLWVWLGRLSPHWAGLTGEVTCWAASGSQHLLCWACGCRTRNLIHRKDVMAPGLSGWGRRGVRLCCPGGGKGQSQKGSLGIRFPCDPRCLFQTHLPSSSLYVPPLKFHFWLALCDSEQISTSLCLCLSPSHSPRLCPLPSQKLPPHS